MKPLFNILSLRISHKIHRIIQWAAIRLNRVSSTWRQPRSENGKSQRLSINRTEWFVYISIQKTAQLHRHPQLHIYTKGKKCWWIHLHSRGIHNKKRNSLRNIDSGFFFVYRYSHFGLNNAWFLIRFVRENGWKKPRKWE